MHLLCCTFVIITCCIIFGIKCWFIITIKQRLKHLICCTLFVIITCCIIFGIECYFTITVTVMIVRYQGGMKLFIVVITSCIVNTIDKHMKNIITDLYLIVSYYCYCHYHGKRRLEFLCCYKCIFLLLWDQRIL